MIFLIIMIFGGKIVPQCPKNVLTKLCAYAILVGQGGFEALFFCP